MADTEQQKADAAAAASAEVRAQRRLAAEKGFYVHLATYAIVIGFLFLINAVTGTKWWFFWPALAGASASWCMRWRPSASAVSSAATGKSGV